MHRSAPGASAPGRRGGRGRWIYPGSACRIRPVPLPSRKAVSLTRSNAPRIPNLFIVGAPKSGTTSFYRYLAAHPDVFMSPIKEPHFFGGDLRVPGLRLAPTRGEYLALFSDATDERWVGEASTWYLASRQAAEEIHASSPDAAIVVMLRNPVQLAHSLHSQCLKTGLEDERGFEHALELEADRRRGFSLPKRGFHQALLYTDAGRYANQVERYLRVFGRERVHVLLFDDLRADTDAAFDGLLTWLGLETAVVRPDRAHNPNRAVRSLWLRDLLDRRAPRFRRLARALVPGPLRPAVHDRLFALNNPVVRRTELGSSTQRRLENLYREDIDRLQTLIRRDLSGWTEPVR